MPPTTTTGDVLIDGQGYEVRTLAEFRAVGRLAAKHLRGIRRCDPAATLARLRAAKKERRATGEARKA